MMLRLRHAARVVHWAAPQGLCAYRLQHRVRYPDSAALQTRNSWAPRRELSSVSTAVASTISTVAEVCEWAGRGVDKRGAGLSEAAVNILQREEINGGSLFNLSDAELHSVGMSLGARKDLLAAVTLLKDASVKTHRAVPQPAGSIEQSMH